MADDTAEMLEQMAAQTPDDGLLLDPNRIDLDHIDAYGQPETLIHYVMELEDLVRWFALLYSYEWYDEEGEKHLSINDPIWTVHTEKGDYLPAAEKLQETWNRVMHPDGPPE